MFETLQAKPASGPHAYPTFESLYGSAPSTSARAHMVRKQKRAAFSFKALSYVALSLFAATLAIQQRQKLADVFPKLAPIYSGIGLPVNVLGLEIRNIKAQILTEGAYSVLAIEGQLANIKKQNTAVAPLQIAILDADGQQIYHWLTDAPKSHLNSGEVTYFRARLTAPPDQADKVIIQFSPIEPIMAPKRK
ncbi:MAG: hypothetical protein EBY21_08000 [Alphaproteobacteria bacterium]|nr:hypothetical protein [Alphaproteobacteria bacterium]